MKVIIDRFEGDYAVVELENRSMADLPQILIPLEAKEGDTLEIIIDQNETRRRKKRIERLTEGLWE